MYDQTDIEQAQANLDAAIAQRNDAVRNLDLAQSRLMQREVDRLTNRLRRIEDKVAGR